MVRRILYVVLLAVIIVPSWQIGSIILEKQKVGAILEDQALRVRKYRSSAFPENELKKRLEREGLPAVFTYEVLEPRKVRITYQYIGDATVFGYTYYQTEENFSVETPD